MYGNTHHTWDKLSPFKWFWFHFQNCWKICLLFIVLSMFIKTFCLKLSESVPVAHFIYDAVIALEKARVWQNEWCSIQIVSLPYSLPVVCLFFFNYFCCSSVLLKLIITMFLIQNASSSCFFVQNAGNVTLARI